MTTGPDNRRVPSWSGFRRLSSVNTSFSYVFDSVDLSARTWSGGVRKHMTSTAVESVTVTCSAAYSAGTGDTTVTVTLTGTQLDALVADNAEWAGWIGVTCTGSPIYGLDGEILIENVVNR